MRGLITANTRSQNQVRAGNRLIPSQDKNAFKIALKTLVGGLSRPKSLILALCLFSTFLQV